MALPGAHRTVRDKTRDGGAYYIRWTAWRGKGAPKIGAFKGATKHEAEQAERAGASELAGGYRDARTTAVSDATLADLLDLYQGSAEFKKCSASTKAERSRQIKLMREDEIPPPRGSTKPALKLGSLPTAGLASRLAIGHLTRWRDDQAATRGPRAADARVQVLRRALAVLVKQGVAPANPAAGLAEVWTADRSALIWEPELLKKYLEHIKAEIWRVWTSVSASNPLRPAMILKLAAARDALLLVLNNGQRREDLAALNWRECTDVAFVYTARKGARRAKTAGKKSRTTIVPILNEARGVLIRRKEAHGADSPWVIVSGRGGAYTPNALGELVNGVARELEIDRHLHDGKGTFVTRIKTQAPWLSNGEIAAMVDWSEGEVDEIIRRYVSADEIARATIERLRDRRKAS
ncbi:MAG: hypothetical protein H7124_01140 [Phycisphaerales bacterium]|nr:hypothetical protein [Hyphomonadaceae bacterium]